MAQVPNNIEEAIEWLSCFGRTLDGGVTRTLYSKSWMEAQQALKEWMEEMGLITYFDSMGNLFGRLSSAIPDAPTIFVGSHIDTVISGGKFDGAYGILAAILAINDLHQKYGKPRINLEVVSLCEEEGSRFPIACSGSRMMTGAVAYKDIVSLRDSEGISFLEAMKAAGFEWTNQEYPVRNDIHAFIELHIEQGPCLEKLEKEIGIVQTIVGQKRYHICVKGETNHVGTTLMKWRRDPLHGSAKMIYQLYQICKDFDDDLVTTVGQLLVTPNAPNVIPGQVDFTVDARHPKEAVLSQFCEQFTTSFSKIAEEMGLEITLHKWHEVYPVNMDEKLNSLAQKICKDNGISHHVMNSGAGHDAQLFARICPAAILFVPSQGGVSHSPMEYTSPKDVTTGLQVLTLLLHQLAY